MNSEELKTEKSYDRETANRLLKESTRYAKTIINSLSAHVAILDEKGVILETNRAWYTFAKENNIRMRPDTLDINYLEICDTATGASDDKSLAVAAGIRAVIRGEVSEFAIDYPCHSPDVKRWFYMKATRAVGPGPLRVVVSHENITELKLAQERLRRREKELEKKTAVEAEANAALRALLRQRDRDKEELEADVFHNLKGTVMPYLHRLKQMKHPPAAKRLIALIESGLDNITSPFLRKFANLATLLTPQEIQIGYLIREGKTSKDIAQLLNLSITTIKFHRRNLRQKLGLKNQSKNLRAYLLSLAK